MVHCVICTSAFVLNGIDHLAYVLVHVLVQYNITSIDIHVHMYMYYVPILFASGYCYSSRVGWKGYMELCTCLMGNVSIATCNYLKVIVKCRC